MEEQLKKDIISVQAVKSRQGRGKEMGDVCRAEIVENNGNKTKDGGVEGDRRGRGNEKQEKVMGL